MGKQPVCVHGNDEVVRFDREYRLVVFQACKDAMLRRCDWEAVENVVLEKYAQGRIEYNPTKKAKPTSYYYAIAKNCAIDMLRSQRFVELDDRAEAEIRDERDQFAMVESEDEKRIVEEAFKGLAVECPDRQKVQILLRYAVNGEERAKLAEEFRVSDDFVSLVKNRWLPRLQKLVRKVIREDMDGKLKFSNTDIGFLRPYMMNW